MIKSLVFYIIGVKQPSDELVILAGKVKHLPFFDSKFDDDN